jgi:hypothetical protein
MKTLSLLAASYDDSETSFDPAFRHIERPEDIGAAEPDGEPASVAIGARALSATCRVPARRSITRRRGSRWLQESKLFNLSSVVDVQRAAIGNPHLSHDEIHRQSEIFDRCVFYFGTSHIWQTLRGMLTSGRMTRRCVREGVQSFHLLRVHAA